MRLAIAAALLATLATPAWTQTAPAPAAISPGTVTLEPMAETAGSTDVRSAFAEEATRALNDAGFLLLPGQGGARYVARLTLTRTPQGAVAATGSAGRPADVSLGDWGAAANVALSSKKTQLRELIVTKLAIEIARTGEAEAVWRGTALTVQPEGSADDAPKAVAAKLPTAAMRGFPAVQEEAISVP